MNFKAFVRNVVSNLEVRGRVAEALKQIGMAKLSGRYDLKKNCELVREEFRQLRESIGDSLEPDIELSVQCAEDLAIKMLMHEYVIQYGIDNGFELHEAVFILASSIADETDEEEYIHSCEEVIKELYEKGTIKNNGERLVKPTSFPKKKKATEKDKPDNSNNEPSSDNKCADVELPNGNAG